MSLERRVRARLAEALGEAGYLDPEGRIVDIVWRELGIREMEHMQVFTPPHYMVTKEQTADMAATTYRHFLSLARAHMSTEIAHRVIEGSVAEYSTERSVTNHPDEQRFKASVLVLTRLA